MVTGNWVISSKLPVPKRYMLESYVQDLRTSGPPRVSKTRIQCN
jgi:hypothetical protein